MESKKTEPNAELKSPANLVKSQVAQALPAAYSSAGWSAKLESLLIAQDDATEDLASSVLFMPEFVRFIEANGFACEEIKRYVAARNATTAHFAEVVFP